MKPLTGHRLVESPGVSPSGIMIPGSSGAFHGRLCYHLAHQAGGSGLLLAKLMGKLMPEDWSGRASPRYSSRLNLADPPKRVEPLRPAGLPRPIAEDRARYRTDSKAMLRSTIGEIPPVSKRLIKRYPASSHEAVTIAHRIPQLAALGWDFVCPRAGYASLWGDDRNGCH